MRFKGNKLNSGFGIIVVAIILVVVASFSMVTFLKRAGDDIQSKSGTTKQLVKIKNQLNKAATANQSAVLVCPADPRLQKNHPNYLKSALKSVGGTFPDCSMDLPHVKNPDNATQGLYFKGLLPTRTLGINDSNAFDENKNYLTYMVATKIKPAGQNYDNYFIVNIDGKSINKDGTYDSGLLNNADKFLQFPNDGNGNSTKPNMVLISHGENGVGAFRKSLTLADSQLPFDKNIHQIQPQKTAGNTPLPVDSLVQAINHDLYLPTPKQMDNIIFKPVKPINANSNAGQQNSNTNFKINYDDNVVFANLNYTGNGGSGPTYTGTWSVNWSICNAATPEWTAGTTWSGCSNGQRERTNVCTPTTGTQTSTVSCSTGNNADCDPATKPSPPATQNCTNSSPCVVGITGITATTPESCDWVKGEYGACNAPAGTWSVGTWGACSVSCGGGTQSRTNTCVAGTGVQTRTVTCPYGTGCTEPAPSSTQACTNSNCGTEPAISQTCNTQSCYTPPTCSGSPLIDYSSSGSVIGAVGDVVVHPDSPYIGSGRSMYFDGNGDYLSVPNSNVFNFGTGDFTIQGWFKAANISGWPLILTKRNVAVSPYAPYFIGIDGGNLVFYSSSNGSSWNVSNGLSFGAIRTNAWYHFRVTRSGNNFYLFLNGNLNNTFTSTASLLVNTSAITIGGGPSESSGEMLISNIEIANTARSTTTFAPERMPLHANNNSVFLATFNTCGDVTCWGEGNNTNPNGGTTPAGPISAKAIYSTTAAKCAIKADNSVQCWGAPSGGGTTPSPTIYAKMLYSNVSFGNNGVFCAIKLDDSVQCWGAPARGGTTPSPTIYARQLSADDGDFCALKTDNSVYCWGQYVTAGIFATNVKNLYGGPYSTCVIKLDNTVQCWGHSGYGGTTPNPVISAKSITMTHAAACAIKLDDTVQCWGDQANGGATPAGPISAKKIVGTTQAMCAIKTNDNVQCWGNSTNGGSTPNPIISAKDLSFNDYSICAIKLDNTMQCWGGGAIGSSATNPGISAKITDGTRHNANFICNIKTDDSVKCLASGFDPATTTKAAAISTGWSACAIKKSYSGTWNISNESACTNAVITRTVTCSTGYAGDCDPDTKPATSISCLGTWTPGTWSACSAATPSWSSGDWSECSAICGGGIQTRINTCTPAAGTQSRTNTCSNGAGNCTPGGETTTQACTTPCPTEPASSQTCNTTSCAASCTTPFYDSSTNAYSMTLTGNVAQNAATPFSGGLGKSAYFDGTGDYITLPGTTGLNLSTGDWTIQGWVYALNTTTYKQLITKRANNGSWGPFSIGLNNNSLVFDASTNGTTWNISAGIGYVNANTWYHFRVVRSGNNFYTFFNGTLANTVTNSGALFTNASPIIIGGETNGFSHNGYLSNIEFANTARSTANFTVPTAPLTADANTQVLAKFEDCISNSVQCWGNGSTYGAVAPSPVINAKFVTTGNERAFCAIKADNTVQCWGDAAYGGTTPAGPISAKKIVASTSSMCAIKIDDTVQCWGNATYGGTTPAGPISAKNIIASNQSGICAIKTDNTVQCWGTYVTTPAGPISAKSLYASAYAWCAIKLDNTVQCWGTAGNGGTTPAGPISAKSIAFTNDAMCAIKIDNTVQCWGLSGNGGTTPNPTISAKSLVGNSQAMCAIKLDDTVQCWGVTAAGGTAPAGPISAKSISFVGASSFCAIKLNDDVQCWGDAGNGGTTPSPTIKAKYLHKAFGQGGAMCAIKLDDTVQCWGWTAVGGTTPSPTIKAASLSNTYGAYCAIKKVYAGSWVVGALGSCSASSPTWSSSLWTDCSAPCEGGTQTRISTCTPTVGSQTRTVTCSTGNDNDCDPLLKPTASQACTNSDCGTEPAASQTCNSQACPVGSLAVCWGRNDQGQAGFKTDSFKSIATGHQHSCAIKLDNTVACWGNNTYNQAPATRAGNHKMLAAGQYHTCAIMSDNSIQCWGRNDNLQAPATRAGNYTAIYAGYFNTCARKSDNNIECWGNNWDGINTPPNIASTSFSAGGYGSACLIRSTTTTASGVTTCWGRNDQNQISVKTDEYKSVATGHQHSCAIKLDNTVACWGLNTNNQAPATRAGNYKMLAAGQYHTCAIMSDNSIQCWGKNDNLQAPATRAGNYTAIYAGYFNTCARKSDNTIECWGNNWDGINSPPNIASTSFSAGGYGSACLIKN
jgi:hypothetical protein